MIAFPNAKINLGLYVTAKRADGYHTIQTLMYPIPLCDALEITPSNAGKNQFKTSGIEVCDNPHENLCFKAWLMMQEKFGLPQVHIHLHKAIPAGAGLGGGSADAAFTIKLVNAFFQLDISTEKMQLLSLLLGMDCPFFIRNEPVIATERGDHFSDCHIRLNGKYLMIVKPPFTINTKMAYAAIKPGIPDFSITKILKQPITSWKRLLKNDFEPYVYQMFPETRKIVSTLYDMGAEYAAMSGSGSAFYGIFQSEIQCNDFFENYYCRSFLLPVISKTNNLL
jgi:4-diphosphocytidyl-2-C-methyl-D-erythritol kinase